MFQHKKLAFLTAATITGLFAFGLKSSVVNADDVNVDTNTAIRANAEHVASGGLYALKDEQTPSADLISPLKPRTFTQAPPDPGQLPNGLKEPGGDFLKVASTADKVGAKVIIRLPDHYATFPYGFSTMEDWKKQIDEMVTKAQQSKKDIYGYELWNEPNWTYQGQNGRTEEDYFKLWDATFKEVRKLDPKATIVGPSISAWDKGWMDKFFTHVTQAHTIPDVISWHLLGGNNKDWTPAGFKNNMADLHVLETKYNIDQNTKVLINEYGTPAELAVPGEMIHYVQAFENTPQVDGADLAFWYNYGRMDNLLTDRYKPNGGYWLYKWYGDMNGQMDKTSTIQTDGNFASVASTTADRSKTSVILGGISGTNNVNISGLDSAKFGQKAKVEINETPWYGVDTPVAAPKTIASGTVSVKNGTAQIPVKDMKAANGYQVVVTPADGSSNAGLQYVQRQASDPIRVEAEDSALTGLAKKLQGSYASGDYYVGTIDNPDSSIMMKVNALQTGDYQLEMGYANGKNVNATEKLTLNGQPLKDATFAPITGWTVEQTQVYGTRKVMQYGTVHLNQGDNTFKISKGDNSAEIDYAQFTLQNSGTTTPSRSSGTTSSSVGSSSSVAASSSSTVTTSSSSTSSTSTITKPATSVSVSRSAAKKGATIIAVKKVNLYKTADFKAGNKLATYSEQTRANRPTFIVIGYARSKNGALRYQVRDTNRGSKTYGKKGYLTTKSRYVQNVYYQSVPKSKTVTVINKRGINAYKTAKLTHKVKHYRVGTQLKVKKLVNSGLNARYQLSNDSYITANKLLLFQGRH